MRAVRPVSVLGPVAFLLAVLALRGSLPDPMATHFVLNGDADGSMAALWFALVMGAVWLLVSLAPTDELQGLIRGGALGLLAGVFVALVAANLDVHDWHEARLGPPSVAVVLAGAAMGVLAAWRMRRMTEP